MQSLLIACIIMLSHGVVLTETTKTPSSETTREATPGSSTPNAEKRDWDAENTGVNVRDKGDVTVTPEEQGGEAGDREITAAIAAR